MSAIHRGALRGWTRGGTSEVVRRAHPASGAQWNVQVVRGKVNGKCLWNACKALSLGLLLMVLGAAMATIGYYADQLSVAEEVRGNYTVAVKNESRGFHLNNLSYAGPIVMGVGGFIVVAACVMTFEARDSAAKVVPARFKLSTTAPPPSRPGSYNVTGGQQRTSASQTSGNPPHPDRLNLTQSFMQFSQGLDKRSFKHCKNSPTAGMRNGSLKVPQSAINRSPSAPDLVLDQPKVVYQKPPLVNLLNPSLLPRQALSVDETNYRSNDSIQQGSQDGSMAMDLHLESVTLKVRDKRRNPLKRQRKFEEDEQTRRNSSYSHTCSPRNSHSNNNNNSNKSKRRSSNSSDCPHRSRTRRRESQSCHHARGRLERAISSDSRLPKCYHSHEPSRDNSTEHENQFNSESDIVRKSSHHHQVMVHFSPDT